jgi:aminopeptidase C
MSRAKEKIKGAYGIFNFCISTSYKEVYLFQIIIEKLFLMKSILDFFIFADTKNIMTDLIK